MVKQHFHQNATFRLIFMKEIIKERLHKVVLFSCWQGQPNFVFNFLLDYKIIKADRPCVTVGIEAH